MSRGSPPRLRDYLVHVLEAVTSIDNYTSGVAQAVFLAPPTAPECAPGLRSRPGTLLPATS